MERHGHTEVATTYGWHFHVERHPKTKEPIARGDLMAIEVVIDSGAHLYALPHQLRGADAGEVDALREREAAAAAILEADRRKLWEGGGKVVYTQ